jgi:DNA-binding transcriptional MerR regulator
MKKHNQVTPKWASIKTVTKLFDLQPNTINSYVESGFLSPGIHFSVLPSGHRRFNLALIEDRIANATDDKAHQRAIDVYLQSLPSMQLSGRR